MRCAGADNGKQWNQSPGVCKCAENSVKLETDTECMADVWNIAKYFAVRTKASLPKCSYLCVWARARAPVCVLKLFHLPVQELELNSRVSSASAFDLKWYPNGCRERAHIQWRQTGKCLKMRSFGEFILDLACLGYLSERAQLLIPTRMSFCFVRKNDANLLELQDSRSCLIWHALRFYVLLMAVRLV